MTQPLPSAAFPGAPSFGEALQVWWRIGLASFGGPAGQIALMHKVLVEERRWLDESRFLHALNYCTLLPGPEAQQLATYSGWLLHGVRGGLAAGMLFVLPGCVVILVLSALYVTLGGVPVVQGLFWGLKAAVLAIVVEALWRLGRRALQHSARWALAGASFIALFFAQVPFPWVVLSAGIIGFVGARRYPAAFGSNHAPSALAPEVRSNVDATPQASPLPPRHAPRPLMTLATWLPIWLVPLAGLALLLGPDAIFTRIGIFFSKMAVVSFGGAYAVLSYVAQQAVEHYQWLSSADMLHGLALAETTPGPLILVLQYVAFVAAAGNPGALHPLLAGTVGSIIALHATFAPCFLWILLGAPYVERLRHHRPLSGALAAINAAVVGVILNLAVWFSLHTLFETVANLHIGVFSIPLPHWSTVDAGMLVLGASAMLSMLWLRQPLLRVLSVCGLAGILFHML